MSIYYGFPIVSNNGDRSVELVLTDIYENIKNYDIIHDLRIENIKNIIENLSMDNNYYGEKCINIQIHNKDCDDDVGFFELVHKDVAIIVMSLWDECARLQLVLSECFSRCSESTEHIYIVDNLLIYTGRYTDDKMFIFNAIQKLVSKYLGAITVDDTNDQQLITQLKEFMTKHKFHEYDLSDEYVNEM
jgi:hypothetical protein